MACSILGSGAHIVPQRGCSHGVNMMSDIKDALRVRNHRLVRHLDAAVVAVVVRFQPDRPALHRMRAEHVRAVADLHT